MTPFSAFSQIKKAHSLAPYTTFRVGGPADYFYDLADLEELPSLVQAAHDAHLPVFVFGAGSNLLFSDHGFRGLVIRIIAKKVTVNGTEITVEAGAPMYVVVDTAKKHGFTGMEPFTGLPGTVGGAVRGNAGCFQKEIKDVVTRVTLFSLEKGFFEQDGSALQFGYRTSVVKEHPEMIVCKTTFTLSHGDIKLIAQEMERIRALRKQKQPPGSSAGSWFKNPSSKQTAGQLLDQAGCKGLTVGGAQISSYHANFFLNSGCATAADLCALNAKAIELVQAKFDVLLEPEIKIVPERI